MQAPLPAIAIAEQRLAVALLAEADHPDRDAFHAAQVTLHNFEHCGIFSTNASIL